MGGARSTYGAKSIAYRISVGKSERKGPLEGTSCRREENVEMDLREIKFGWYGLD
jgi:hypothetical protein